MAAELSRGPCTTVLCALILASVPRVARARGPEPAETPLEKTESETTQAVLSQPQVPSIRGGTLGIPPNGTSRGLQTMIDGKFSNGDTDPDETTSVDFFAKLAGLGFTDSLDAEVLVERYQENIPHVSLATLPVEPRMVLTDMTSIGFRIRWLFENRSWLVSRAKPESQHIAEKTAARVFVKNQGRSLLAGLRFLKRSTTDTSAKDFSGVAGEFSLVSSSTRSFAAGQECPKADPKPCENSYRFTWFVSVSGTHLNDERQDVEGARVLFPSFSEVRLSGGMEFQTSGVIRGAPALPRVGAYATLSRGLWANDFAIAEQEKDIHGTQWEAAAYVAGHFFSGFNGLVSFGVLRPYGHEERLQYVLSVAPAVGASLGND